MIYIMKGGDNKLSCLVSIIVPVYNAIRYVNKCVDSILDQTYRNLEIILVDDGSTDGSSVICDEYAKKDERVIIIHKENGGVSSARNIGMDKARGEFLAFVDSDDYLHPQFCELMITGIGQSDIEECQFYTVLNEEQMDYNRIESCTINRIPAKERKLSLLRNGGGRVWGCLFKTEIIKKLRFDVGFRYAEDTLFSYDALNLANEVVLIQETLYYYHKHDQSAMSKIDKDGINDIVKAEKLLYEREKELVSATSSYNERSTLAFLSIKVMYTLKRFEKWNDYYAFRKINKKNLKMVLSQKFKYLSIKEKLYLIYELFFVKRPID